MRVKKALGALLFLGIIYTFFIGVDWGVNQLGLREKWDIRNVISTKVGDELIIAVHVTRNRIKGKNPSDEKLIIISLNKFGISTINQKDLGRDQYALVAMSPDFAYVKSRNVISHIIALRQEHEPYHFHELIGPVGFEKKIYKSCVIDSADQIQIRSTENLYYLWDVKIKQITKSSSDQWGDCFTQDNDQHPGLNNYKIENVPVINPRLIGPYESSRFVIRHYTEKGAAGKLRLSSIMNGKVIWSISEEEISESTNMRQPIIDFGFAHGSKTFILVEDSKARTNAYLVTIDNDDGSIENVDKLVR